MLRLRLLCNRHLHHQRVEQMYANSGGDATNCGKPNHRATNAGWFSPGGEANSDDVIMVSPVATPQNAAGGN